MKTAQEITDLVDTLQANDHIETVYFTAKGDHYFHAHEVKDQGSFARVIVEKQIVDYRGADPVYKTIYTPVESTKIVASLTAQEIIDSPDLLSSPKVKAKEEKAEDKK